MAASSSRSTRKLNVGREFGVVLNADRLDSYQLFGLTLVSDFPFASRLAQTATAPDIAFTLVDAPPVPPDWQAFEPAYTSPFQTAAGVSVGTLHRLTKHEVLRFTDVGDFYLGSDHIVCHPLRDGLTSRIEITLLGVTLAYWLERAGTPALHASAVVSGSRAVAFLSHTRAGKSTLATALMAAGDPLLTDDLLAISPGNGGWIGQPGYPMLRMWPAEVEHIRGRYEDLPLVHPWLTKRWVPVGPDGGFGSFCDQPQRLGCIYVPQRRESRDWRDRIEIVPVRPTEAVLELVRYSFLHYLVEALGWQPRRLALFARLVEEVPVRRLIYPSGLEYLPRVRDAILDDLARL